MNCLLLKSVCILRSYLCHKKYERWVDITIKRITIRISKCFVFVICYGFQFRTSRLPWYAWCLLRRKRLVKSTVQFSRFVFGGKKRGRSNLSLSASTVIPLVKTSLWNEFTVSLYSVFWPSNLSVAPKWKRVKSSDCSPFSEENKGVFLKFGLFFYPSNLIISAK